MTTIRDTGGAQGSWFDAGDPVVDEQGIRGAVAETVAGCVSVIRPDGSHVRRFGYELLNLTDTDDLIEFLER